LLGLPKCLNGNTRPRNSDFNPSGKWQLVSMPSHDHTFVQPFKNFHRLAHVASS
jgi:hypothetical protein